MNKAMFDELFDSVKEMDQIAQGKREAARVSRVPALKVKVIREKTGLSQMHFALLIGVSQRTLENWEQDRRQPSGPAKALLRILAADPEHAIQALSLSQSDTPSF